MAIYFGGSRIHNSVAFDLHLIAHRAHTLAETFNEAQGYLLTALDIERLESLERLIGNLKWKVENGVQDAANPEDIPWSQAT